jgi:hypothetical protein
MKIKFAAIMAGRVVSIFDAETWSQAEQIREHLQSLLRPGAPVVVLREATEADVEKFDAEGMAGVVVMPPLHDAH